MGGDSTRRDRRGAAWRGKWEDAWDVAADEDGNVLLVGVLDRAAAVWCVDEEGAVRWSRELPGDFQGSEQCRLVLMGWTLGVWCSGRIPHLFVVDTRSGSPLRELGGPEAPGAGRATLDLSSCQRLVFDESDRSLVGQFEGGRLVRFDEQGIAIDLWPRWPGAGTIGLIRQDTTRSLFKPSADDNGGFGKGAAKREARNRLFEGEHLSWPSASRGEWGLGADGSLVSASCVEKHVLFHRVTRAGLCVFRVAIPVSGDVRILDDPAVDRQGRTYLLIEHDRRGAVWRLDADGNNPTQIFRGLTPAKTPPSLLALTPDGQVVLVGYGAMCRLETANEPGEPLERVVVQELQPQAWAGCAAVAALSTASIVYLETRALGQVEEAQASGVSLQSTMASRGSKKNVFQVEELSDARTAIHVTAGNHGIFLALALLGLALMRRPGRVRPVLISLALFMVASLIATFASSWSFPVGPSRVWRHWVLISLLFAASIVAAAVIAGLIESADAHLQLAEKRRRKGQGK